MHNGTTITKIIESVSATTDDDLVSEVLKKLKFCHFCEEYFTRSYSLMDHIRNSHPDKLVCNTKRSVKVHEVAEGEERIYICPHCHFAVGISNPHSASTSMIDHLLDHRKIMNIQIDLSFSHSEDKELIQKYIEGTAEIELFHCLFCNEAYGVSEALLEHLRFIHSDASDENIERIRGCVKRFLEENKKGEITPPIERSLQESTKEDLEISAPTTKVEPIISVGTEFSKTSQNDEIEKGILCVPPNLRRFLTFTEQIKVQFRRNWAAILPYEKSNGYISGLNKWYLKNAIEQGDNILFRLLALDKPEIRIWTEWEKHLNYIFKCPPEDFEWQSLPIRDCLLRVFNELNRSAHYDELYAHISKHRDLAIGSVIATLSKYKDILFEYTTDGNWKFLQEPKRVKLPSGRQRVQPPLFERTDSEEDIWNIVKKIEEGDIVYKLLDKTGEDMSLTQICQKIAEYYNIDWHNLRDKEFINVNDTRIKRRSNGHFALTKWFDDSRKPIPPIKESEINLGEKEQLPKKAEEVLSGLFKLFWVICKRFYKLFVHRSTKE